jgi:ribosomal protein S18 acetylase RimI-like enzyme
VEAKRGSREGMTTIRPLEKQDRTSVIELVTATGNFSDAERAIAEELIDIYTDQPDQKDYFAYVATLEGAVAGFLILGPTPATSGTYDMYWIAVHPMFYGRGVAQALDSFAVQFVRDRKGYWLIAETSGQSNYDRTRAFYQKQGYREVARIPDYYKPNDDLVIYGKRLDG